MIQTGNRYRVQLRDGTWFDGTLDVISKLDSGDLLLFSENGSSDYHRTEPIGKVLSLVDTEGICYVMEGIRLRRATQLDSDSLHALAQAFYRSCPYDPPEPQEIVYMAYDPEEMLEEESMSDSPKNKEQSSAEIAMQTSIQTGEDDSKPRRGRPPKSVEAKQTEVRTSG